jgi:hypothetical protein
VITLRDTARTATYGQRFTHYSVKEIGSKPIDIAAASGHSMFSLAIAERERHLTAQITPDEAEETEWKAEYLFHRRIPPRSFGDDN